MFRLLRVIIRPSSELIQNYIVVLVLVFYLCPSSVRVVVTFSGTVLFPLLCSHFFPNTLILFLSNFVIPISVSKIRFKTYFI